MSMSWADLRFIYNRGAGLALRGLTSLRTRGLRASWQRLRPHLRRLPAAQRPTLHLPAHEPFSPFALPAAPTPRASIVIPVYNQFAHTLDCLRALAATPPQVGIEVIVVDDGSSDQTEECLRQVDGLRYHRRDQNGGFIAASNDGAALARGEYLVFLNNDTVPQPGWLNRLLATFDEHPGTGLVGAQLVYPDGRLQEAGGIVFADGSGWNYGRFGSALDPRYAFLRDADYCSGAALALPRELFQQLGGFDTRYAPAYFEDTDLAFAVRAAGWRTLYQPAARVVHAEGATAGTDLSQGMKAHQAPNQQQFADKWRQQLRSQPAPSTPPDRAARAQSTTTVLVVDALTPRPDRDSGSLRLVNLMRLLRQEGAHVVFIAADRAHDSGYTEALQQLGIEVWYAPFATSLPAWLRAQGRRFDSALVCRHYVMRDLLPLLRRHAPQARLVFDSIDLHYLRERRGAELANDPKLARAAQRTQALELDVIARSDATLVVSQTELDLLAHDAPQARVEVLSNLHDIAASGPGFEARKDLVFVGGFRHPPNVDAVRWFIDDVWPRVRARRPNLVFHCIGADVPAQIQALADRPGVRIHGHVPDIGPYMDGARLAVAPLRYGAGVKGKVNLSMAHGQPVVATTCAVEGMHLADGDDVLVADDADAFAAAIVRLHDDPVVWQRLADNGRRNIERHFSLEVGRDVVRRVLLERSPGTGKG